ncbi:MAG: SOS response-associated peptidase [Chloroflexi bacterium]|nr:SOS response-associated peptidase [Chloroflexota bacterium]
MCGRFTLTVNPADLQDAFTGFRFPPQFAPRFNIAPSQPLLAIPNDRSREATFFLWGFIPGWAKDAAFDRKLINARGETLAEKPSFKGAYKYRRCLILADGFYEWKTKSGIKKPHFIFMKSRQAFAFAGLWSDWESADGSRLKTCAIITTEPNELMKPIHKRMPVILPRSAYSQWLDPRPRSDLQSLMRPYPAEEMEAYPVSTLVNNPANDRAECVVPV